VECEYKYNTRGSEAFARPRVTFIPPYQFADQEVKKENNLFKLHSNLLKMLIK
jgi:hypothetical protein